MCRSNSRTRLNSTRPPLHMIVLWLVVFITSAGQQVLAEEVDVWLEERGLTRLLAEHLEQRIETLSGESRAEAVIRLAKIYAVLLAETEDRAQRISLEERGRRLLAEVSGSAADELKLELSHGSYLGIESLAERHRLRLLDESDLEKLLERTRTLIAELEVLHGKIESSLRRARMSAGNRSSRPIRRSSRLAELEQMLDRINFLMGWCRYYQAWLTGAVGPAEQAELHFSDVLDLKEISPGDVSQDLRSETAIAWTIIGMSMAQSITSSSLSAMQWLDLLDSANVSSVIRSQLPGWRLAVLLEAGEFDQAARILASSGATVAERPVGWTRMTAVYSLEQPGNPAADALAAEALADLASIGALGQIQDIVNRYGDSAEANSFPFGYARAVIKYQHAQELLQSSSPVDAVDLRYAWREAAEEIERALQAEDADRFDAARYQAILLHAWSLYHLEEFDLSRQRFESAAEFLPESEAAEAIWMAYVSEERRCETDPGIPRIQRDRLVNLYLERFPRGPRAGELMVRRASQDEEPSMARVKELLAVPLDSPSRDLAQMRASDMLYRMFRASKPAARLDVASEYLAIAVPMMQEDYVSSESVAEARSVARARRVLEVATDPNVLRMVAADSSLLVLLNREVLTKIEDEDLEDEVDYRRVLLALARDEQPEAQALVDIVCERNPGSIWARLATRRAFDRARLDREAGGAVARDAMKRIVRNGVRILAESGDTATALQERSGLSIASAIASAASDLWFEGADVESGEQAWELYGVLLEHSPRNRLFLAGRGRLAAARGETEEALRCWRIVTAGSRAGSNDWFEARLALLEILEISDPVRAREVMAQHRVLYPEYGPAPWGDQLRDIALRMGVAGQVSPDEDEEEDGAP